MLFSNAATLKMAAVHLEGAHGSFGGVAVYAAKTRTRERESLTIRHIISTLTPPPLPLHVKSISVFVLVEFLLFKFLYCFRGFCEHLRNAEMTSVSVFLFDFVFVLFFFVISSSWQLDI